MGFVKRRASTIAKVSLSNFNDLKAQFLFDIMINVRMDEIPDQLIINWDQTAINYVPSGSWTMEKSGSQRVEIVANDDKRQITAVFAGTLTGDLLANLSFAMRREDILNTLSLKEVLLRYPFLQQEDEVHYIF